MRTFRNLAVLLTATAAVAVIVPALGLAARPVVTGPYPANFCGVAGTQVNTSVIGNIEEGSDGFFANERFHGVFTATASGKSIELAGAGVVKVRITDNGDGTVTFHEQDAGLVLQFKIPNGPILKDADGKPILGAGILETIDTVDIATDELLASEATWHGPHPLRDGVDICGPAIAYLTS